MFWALRRRLCGVRQVVMEFLRDLEEEIGFSMDDFGLEVGSAELGSGAEGGVLGRSGSVAGLDWVLKPRGFGRRMAVLVVAATM